MNWSVSAENEDRELVISLCMHRFSNPQGNSIKYQDFVDRWSGHRNKEFRERIEKAYNHKQIVRAVIALTSDVEAVEHGSEAGRLINEFHVREDWYGEVTPWDGNNFEITFTGK